MKPFNNITVSSEEPTNNADVWIKYSKNLFDRNKIGFINGYFYEESVTIQTSTLSKCFYLPIDGNKEYVIRKIPSTRFNVATTSEVPTIGINIIDNAKNMTSSNEVKNPERVTLKASENAKYMVVWYYSSNSDTLTEDEILNSITIKLNIEDDISVNDNGVYRSILKKIRVIEGNFTVTQSTSYSEELNYPDDYNRTNCIPIACSITSVDTKGDNYIGFYNDSLDGLINAFTRTLNLENDKIILKVKNPNTSALDIKYKIVLMKIY